MLAVLRIRRHSAHDKPCANASSLCQCTNPGAYLHRGCAFTDSQTGKPFRDASRDYPTLCWYSGCFIGHRWPDLSLPVIIWDRESLAVFFWYYQAPLAASVTISARSRRVIPTDAWSMARQSLRLSSFIASARTAKSSAVRVSPSLSARLDARIASLRALNDASVVKASPVIVSTVCVISTPCTVATFARVRLMLSAMV